MPLRHQRSNSGQTQTQLGTLSELNVTPLLDLAFVLLIIFMITAPFLAQSSDLIIPTSNAADRAVDPSQVQIIGMTNSGELSLGEQPLDAEALRLQLETMFEADPNLAVVIKADKRLTVEDVIGVMDLVKGVGITKVGMVTKPEGDQ
ncbi:MAG: biopolymer transporter ExbD [Verrucomicrobiota bacterium]